MPVAEREKLSMTIARRGFEKIFYKQDQQDDALYGSEDSGNEIPEQIRDRNQRIEKLKQIQKQLDQ